MQLAFELYKTWIEWNTYIGTSTNVQCEYLNVGHKNREHNMDKVSDCNRKEKDPR
jgi:hypothetical protein